MSIEIAAIRDAESGASAKIAVGYGCNCFSFTVPSGEQSLEILWAEAGFESGKLRASSSGIPVLFPFPGRLKGGLLGWEGKEYHVPESDRAGNAIHGFVHTRPWRTVAQSENSVTAEFTASIDDASILEMWPSDFRIKVTYSLTGTTLSAVFEATNCGDASLPCGLGTHPYFRVPLGGSSADACHIQVPYHSQWEFADKMATGEKTPAEPLDAPFAATSFDNAFGDLDWTGGKCLTSIEDPESGVKITQTFSDEFIGVVLYNPAHREAFCIEPYTLIPDAFQVTAKGIDAGLRVLQPGESFTAKVDIAVALTK
ncbi:aldose 1-epimerase [Blastopirellula sp. JC732]|uniref:Aldose 1-epimerase n=1 Tax=Blastopirellula sediminis TaxID=2894196 RepID=A0A9X1ML56_9BACT|nr:aldose 1-epimerase [Blastopirellula sediminis]MCC9608993.1 aldose 1-epimerase [Blastopirellula sediminis]MCC9628230.1 aldose 1-epimerase [Blastopirellula sediminis]